LRANTDIGNVSADTRPNITAAALAISASVESLHRDFAEVLLRPVSDLRHGVGIVRRRILCAAVGQQERTDLFAACKALDRLHLVHAELRHFSEGGLNEVAGKANDILERFGDIHDRANSDSSDVTADGSLTALLGVKTRVLPCR
jgi:hypothetical protein